MVNSFFEYLLHSINKGRDQQFMYNTYYSVFLDSYLKTSFV